MEGACRPEEPGDALGCSLASYFLYGVYGQDDPRHEDIEWFDMLLGDDVMPDDSFADSGCSLV